MRYINVKIPYMSKGDLLGLSKENSGEDVSGSDPHLQT